MSEFVTPTTVRVDMHDADLFRDGDPPVYVIKETGQFAAKLKGRWVKRISLPKLDKVIMANGDSVRLFRDSDSESYSHNSPQVMDVSQMTDSMVRDQEGKKHSRYGQWFEFDQAIVDGLNALEKEKLAFMREHYKRRKKLLAKGKRVYSQNFREVLAASLAAPKAKKKKATSK